jgi:glucose/arabinose dehydrogenase
MLLPQCSQFKDVFIVHLGSADTLRPVKTNFSMLSGVVALGFSLFALPTMAGEAKAGLKLLAEGFTSPVALVPLTDGSGRLLVADQVGTVQVLSKDGKLTDDLFLDVRDRLTKLNKGFDERGLIGLALHPRFKENRRIFVVYSAPLRKETPTNWDHTLHLSEFKALADNLAKADPASERVLLEIDKPYFNHNSGCLAFGPDGFLYMGVGDGGNANDVGTGHPPQGNGQDTTQLLAKILRLDIDTGNPYGIPSDNPFRSGSAGRPEIYAYGLRNPWRITFDRGGTHELFAADIGQTMFEEVDIIVKGGNYGWNIREGFHCFDPKNPNKPPEDCAKAGADGKPLLDPILEYKNINGFKKDPEGRGISITGGYVYRGAALPQLQGRYIFADWSRTWAKADGVLFVATRPSSSATRWTMDSLDLVTHPGGKVGAYILAFGEDTDGELYVMTNGSNTLMGKNGKVWKLAAMSSGAE